MAASFPSGLQFAIADLDGDRKPDLALVEVESQRLAKTDYSIRLQLSAGTASTIGINAPHGGLRVAARDVNGDHSIDLVLTSNLDARFIAVLLNDGHGNFSEAAPGAYLNLEEEVSVLLTGPAATVTDEAALAFPRSLFGGEAVCGCKCQTLLSSGSLPFARDWNVRRKVAHSRLGRSPPVFAAFS